MPKKNTNCYSEIVFFLTDLYEKNLPEIVSEIQIFSEFFLKIVSLRTDSDTHLNTIPMIEFVELSLEKNSLSYLRWLSNNNLW